MSVDAGFGPKGNPQFDPEGAVEDWVDFGAVGEFAASVGNRRVGTRADRMAMVTTPGAELRAYEGLEFEQLDGVDKGLWKFLGGAWTRYKPVDFAFLRDGATPANIADPPPITGGHELITQHVLYRFITTAQAEIGSSWSPYRAFPKPFPNGVLSVQVTPVVLGGSWPTTPQPMVSHVTLSQFRLFYSGSTAVTERAAYVTAHGF